MKKYLFAFVILFSVVSVFVVTPVLAASLDVGLDYGTFTGLGSKDLRIGVMTIVNVLFTFLGVLTIIMMLYAGFLWLTSAGSEEKTGQAKKIITSAIIGLVIIFISYGIASFVIDNLIKATTDQQVEAPAEPAV